ncbi:MAG: hypothetical protein WCK15_25175 [Pirellula sp.]
MAKLHPNLMTNVVLRTLGRIKMTNVVLRIPIPANPMFSLVAESKKIRPSNLLGVQVEFKLSGTHIHRRIHKMRGSLRSYFTQSFA